VAVGYGTSERHHVVLPVMAKVHYSGSWSGRALL